MRRTTLALLVRRAGRAGLRGRRPTQQAASAAAAAGADVDNDGIADLAASAPAEDVGSVFNAGAVSAGGRLLAQNSPGGPGTAEDFDAFGGNSFNAG